MANKCNSAQHYCGIGGQAVLEGVMMKNGDNYAVAVRKEDGSIVLRNETYKGFLADTPVRKIPIVRGFFVLIDSLTLGLRVTDYSASMYDPDEAADPESPKEKFLTGLILAVSMVIAVALFILLPYGAASLLSSLVGNSGLLVVFEGILRVAIFLLYIWGITAMEDIKRLYQYHGAEHKCINCLESGLPLTVENARKSTSHACQYCIVFLYPHRQPYHADRASDPSDPGHFGRLLRDHPSCRHQQQSRDPADLQARTLDAADDYQGAR